MRSILVLLHRYIGLATAIFLFLAGITGSILAFHHELDEWLNPEFYHTTSEGPVLAPGTLVERVEQANPRRLGEPRAHERLAHERTERVPLFVCHCSPFLLFFCCFFLFFYLFYGQSPI